MNDLYCCICDEDFDASDGVITCPDCGEAGNFECDQSDDHDGFLTDAEADGDALASAGLGTDEDYGCFNSGDDW